MTPRRQIIRLFILVPAVLLLTLGVRELLYFRSIHESGVMAKVEVPDTARRSTLIVLANIEKSIGTSRYYDAGGELIVGTRWKVNVTESLKGTAPDSLVVRTLGGRYGLTVLWVEDEVEFIESESVLLFLEPDPSSDDYRTVDNYQGHFTIQGDQAVQQETEEAKPLAEFEAMIRATQ